MGQCWARRIRYTVKIIVYPRDLGLGLARCNLTVFNMMFVHRQVNSLAESMNTGVLIIRFGNERLRILVQRVQ